MVKITHNESKPLQERVSLLERGLDDLHVELGEIKNLIIDSSKQKTEALRFILTIVVPIVFALGGGLWVVINLRMENIVNANQSELVGVREQNSASSKDREHLNVEIARLYTDFDQLRSQVMTNQAARVQKEAEIETQFNSDAQLRNVQWCEQQRINSVMWNASGKLPPYPSGPSFQPNVTSRGHTQD